MENHTESTLQFDLNTVGPTEILIALQARSQAVRAHNATQNDATFQSPSLSVAIANARGQDFIGAGLREIGEVSIQGAIGDFGCCSFGDGVCHIDGNVGHFFGHSIASGILVVRGHAKNAVGALGAGGLIGIYGNAGDRMAIGMQGADIVVRGSVGNYAGIGMQSGTLIIGGNAGTHLGHAMRSGTVYLRGEAESISPNIEEQRLREPDRLKIGMLMLKSNLKSAGKEFRVFRPVREEA